MWNVSIQLDDAAAHLQVPSHFVSSHLLKNVVQSPSGDPCSEENRAFVSDMSVLHLYLNPTHTKRAVPGEDNGQCVTV